MNCCLGDIPRNIDKHVAFITNAQKQGCDLLVFPELSLTGYRVEDFGYKLALPTDCDELKQLAAAAGEQMTVIIGFIEEGPCGLIYNSTALIDKGQVAFVHRKMSLPTFGRFEEGKYYAEGRNLNVHRWSREWTISSLICQDIWQPSLVHIAAMKGTTLFVCPFCSARGGFGQRSDSSSAWEITSRYIAMIYGMPAMLCNRVGQEKDYDYWGCSSILDPYGNIVVQAGQDEELIVGQLNYDDVRDARYKHPIVRDCRIDTTIRELKKIADKGFGD